MPPPQRQPIIGQRILDDLLDLMEIQLTETGTWEIGVQQLCSLADIPFVDGYRNLYQSRRLVSGYIPDTFEFENVADMMSFLSGFSDINVWRKFTNAGAHVDHDDTSELSALYYDEVLRILGAHTLDVETFAQMVARFKTTHRAFLVYKEYFFDLDSVAEHTIERFQTAKKYGRPKLGEYSVRRCLDRLFERKILDNDRLFEPLLARLIGSEDHSTAGPTTDPAVEGALNDLGLNRLPDSMKELRDHYKSLMKTYHPDINPSGLDMSKRINAAYAELVARTM
jgi:hypothetical protein